MPRRLAARLLGLGFCSPVAAAADAVRRRRAAPADFLVYYGAADDPAIAGFDLVVLDAEAPAALLARRAPGATMLGYVSACEVHAGRAWHAEVAAAGLLVGPNPNWPDAWFVDVRDERWARLLLDRVVPAVLARGFDGVFLDTLDDAEHLERLSPGRFGGMVEGAAQLVRRIRRRFPAARIMVNRGYALLPRIAGRFDMLLGESVRATHSAAAECCTLVSEADYDWQRTRMWEARRRDPALRLFSLDYWDPEDREGLARLYAEQRANGFVPYVATPDLTRIVPPP